LTEPKKQSEVGSCSRVARRRQQSRSRYGCGHGTENIDGIGPGSDADVVGEAAGLIGVGGGRPANQNAMSAPGQTEVFDSERFGTARRRLRSRGIIANPTRDKQIRIAVG